MKYLALMTTRLFCIALLSMLLMVTAATHAADYCVRPGATGNNSGADWNNAYTSLPSTLERGSTYYLADGSYGYYTFDDSGTATITIKKATPASHGPDTGWNNTYGDNVAYFTGLVFSQGYYTFDGVTGGGPDNWRSGHGFDVIKGSSEYIINLVGNARHIDIRHTRIHGPNLDVHARGINGTTSNPDNISIRYCWIHTTFGVHFYMLHWNHVLVEYSCIEENKSTAAWHSESIVATGADNVILRYNYWRKINGTAVIAGINAGYASQNWEIYGNIINLSTYFIYMYNEPNGTNWTWAENWKIYNNTIVGPYHRGNINGDLRNTQVYNNLWHDFQEPNNYMTFQVGDRQYNSLYDVDLRGTAISGSNLALSGDPLVDHPNQDFHLTAATHPGVTLPAPYNTDMYGNIRGADGNWDRGALEFGPSGPRVVDHHIFYNNSSFDNNDPTPNTLDDSAIATDKSPLLPGQTASFVNYTSYDKGINGLMIDISETPASLTAADFEFRAGNNSLPDTWPTVTPSAITIRPAAGTDGSDRVTLIFPDYAITKKWLRVTVKANDNTGLTDAHVFFYGNAVGETGNAPSDTLVDAADEINCRINPRHFLEPAGLNDQHDFNRDGKVDASDEIIARNNTTHYQNALRILTP